MGLIKEEVFRNQLKESGFVIIPEFLSPEEVSRLKDATEELVKTYCKEDAPVSIFKDQSRDLYFAESGDKIRGFYEENKNTVPGSVLNKIGHALHTFHPTFRSTTFSDKVKEVVKAITDVKDPVVVQSMVIFKHAKVGGAVNPHQDATFLYTEPTPGTLVGFWIALDEASIENGCLHFFRGSHKSGELYQRFVRNDDKSSDNLFITRGVQLPELSKDTLTPAPCKPGDLVLIDGLVVHQSAPNLSSQSRLAYTFHIIDGQAKYSEENWLQPTDKNTFEKLNEN